MREMDKPYLLLIVYCMVLLIYLQLVVSGSLVRFLPGFDGPLPFELETGYVGVDESEDVQLFYYFLKSERNHTEDPLLIWLTGGKGCSSISGLLFEIGPVAFKDEEYNGSVPTLVSTSYSWTKAASIIFLDSPVGAGFSYARTPQALQSSDSVRVYRVDQFIRKWLVNHPEFISNPFYVGGDSYAGKIVPAVVQQVSQGNEEGIEPSVNIQGYLIGNPLTDITVDLNYRIPFAHSMGLISAELYESLKKSCRGEYFNVDPSNSKCLKDLQDYNKCVSGIYEGQILLPNCDMDFVKVKHEKVGRRRELQELLGDELLLPAFGCHSYRYLLSAYWANDEKVRKALHVKKGSIGKWMRCNGDNIPYSNDIPSSFQYHMSNSLKGFRSLVYSGDHDLLIPYLGTQAWIRALNYSIIDDWRPWMINGQIAGYTRTYANKMNFATIKGGGHTAEYMPEECSVMFQRWIKGQPL